MLKQIDKVLSAAILRRGTNSILEVSRSDGFIVFSLAVSNLTARRIEYLVIQAPDNDIVASANRLNSIFSSISTAKENPERAYFVTELLESDLLSSYRRFIEKLQPTELFTKLVIEK